MNEITDVIQLNEEQEMILHSLWDEPAGDKSVPSDIFFANTIPLCNFAIENERIRAEYSVYDKPVEWEKLNGFNKPVYIFMEETITSKDKKYKGVKLMSLIGGVEGLNFINIVAQEIFINGKSVSYKLSPGEDARNEMYSASKYCTEIWYGIQIAMLHPTVKIIFSNPHKEKERIPKDDRKKYGQKIYRYVKHHTITTDELKDAVYGKGEKGEFHRHALIWYVTGHWREYKNGKTVFIQGYWKGALRETKKAEIRNRELVV